jgi:hypothetical protein
MSLILDWKTSPLSTKDCLYETVLGEIIVNKDGWKLRDKDFTTRYIHG